VEVVVNRLVAFGANTLRADGLRAFLVVGALVSLCLSDNVGPRLLPLPDLSEFGSEAHAPGSVSNASGEPSRGRLLSARVEMAAPQNRAGAERHPPLTAALAAKVGLVTPHAAPLPARSLLQPVTEPTPFSRPEGRGPPGLI
jgi:hypothetical protein